MRNWIIGVLTLIVAINAILGLIYQPVWWFLILTLFIWCVAIYDANQKHHSILRNFPLIGRVRWTVEALRPYLQQYVLETDTGGAPISRMFRTIVYQRAKNNRETVPFGTQLDTYENGYEWIGHSLSARELKEMEDDPRVNIGGPDCKKPYSASVLNISAMSFGSLSKNAILALNKGAAKGGFFHNTGAGGVTPYHLENGGEDCV